MDPSANNNQHSEMGDTTSENRLQRSYTDIGCTSMSVESYAYSRTVSELSSYSETNDSNSTSSGYSPLQWPMEKIMAHTSRFRTKQIDTLDDKVDDEEAYQAELEMMKERFSKLLLGEDMSGGGKGVCTAVAISNAITNLYATAFGQFKKLEPLPAEKKFMWRTEMNCLLSVCDYIVEFSPSSQTLPDGTTIEVMESKSRLDICMNLPALQKLDSMLLEILDSFHDKEFWYIEEEKLSPKIGAVGSFRQAIPRNEEKWWLPVPCVPSSGLSERSRRQMHQKRKCADQIQKAARAINSCMLTEMEVPESYMATLPKSGREKIGDAVYRYMATADPFSPEYLLNCLEIKSEHEALDVADRVEAAMYVWRHKASMQNSKSSWDLMKLSDGDKNVTLATRAESILLCLEQRYPELSQTTVDTCKIQFNKDVGQAILESYSRVLESLAFNVVARIDDVLYIDGSVKSLSK